MRLALTFVASMLLASPAFAAVVAVPVPEPESGALLAAGIMALLVGLRARARK